MCRRPFSQCKEAERFVPDHQEELKRQTLRGQCTAHRVKEAPEKLRTLLRNDVQRDCEPGVFDELDDVGVRHADDGLSVDSKDAVAHLQLPAPVGGAALNDASNFMGHSWRQTVIRPLVRKGCGRETSRRQRHCDRAARAAHTNVLDRDSYRPWHH